MFPGRPARRLAGPCSSAWPDLPPGCPCPVVPHACSAAAPAGWAGVLGVNVLAVFCPCYHPGLLHLHSRLHRPGSRHIRWAPQTLRASLCCKNKANSIFELLSKCTYSICETACGQLPTAFTFSARQLLPVWSCVRDHAACPAFDHCGGAGLTPGVLSLQLVTVFGFPYTKSFAPWIRYLWSLFPPNLLAIGLQYLGDATASKVTLPSQRVFRPLRCRGYSLILQRRYVSPPFGFVLLLFLLTDQQAWVIETPPAARVALSVGASAGSFRSRLAFWGWPTCALLCRRMTGASSGAKSRATAAKGARSGVSTTTVSSPWYVPPSLRSLLGQGRSRNAMESLITPSDLPDIVLALSLDQRFDLRAGAEAVVVRGAEQLLQVLVRGVLAVHAASHVPGPRLPGRQRRAPPLALLRIPLVLDRLQGRLLRHHRLLLLHRPRAAPATFRWGRGPGRRGREGEGQSDAN